MFFDSSPANSDAEDNLNNYMHSPRSAESIHDDELSSNVNQKLKDKPQIAEDIALLNKVLNLDRYPERIKSSERYNDFVFTQSQKQTSQEHEHTDNLRKKKKKSKKRKHELDLDDKRKKKNKKKKHLSQEKERIEDRVKAAESTKQEETGDVNDVEIINSENSITNNFKDNKKSRQYTEIKEELEEELVFESSDSSKSYATNLSLDSNKLQQMVSYLDTVGKEKEKKSNAGSALDKKTKLQQVINLDTTGKEKEQKLNAGSALDKKTIKLQQMINYLDITGKENEKKSNAASALDKNSKGIKDLSKDKEHTPDLCKSVDDVVNESLLKVTDLFKIRESSPKAVRKAEILSTSATKDNNRKRPKLNLIKDSDSISNKKKAVVSKSESNLNTSNLAELELTNGSPAKRTSITRKKPKRLESRSNKLKKTVKSEGRNKNGIVTRSEDTKKVDMLCDFDKLVQTILETGTFDSSESLEGGKAKGTPKNTSATKKKLPLNTTNVRNGIESEVTRSDIMMLSELYIDVNYRVADLHRIETRITAGPTKEQQDQILELELEVKKGPYTTEEDEILKENWILFCRHHNLSPRPELFVTFTHDLSGEKVTLDLHSRISFVQYLAKGLNNRLLSSVYKRFQTIFSSVRRGKFTKKEDDFIMDTISASRNSYGIYSRIAKEINRDRLAVEKRYIWLRDAARHDYKTEKISRVEGSLFMIKLLTEMGCHDVHDLKDKFIPRKIFNKISLEMKIRPVKLSQYWYCNLHPKFFVTGTRTMWKVKNRLLDLILADDKIHSIRDVKYTDYLNDMVGWTTYALSKVLNQMRQHFDPESGSFRTQLLAIKNGIDKSDPRLLKTATFINGELFID